MSYLFNNIEMAQEQGVNLVACTMTMDLLGLQKEELIDGLDYTGVAAYLGDANGSQSEFIHLKTLMKVSSK